MADKGFPLKKSLQLIPIFLIILISYLVPLNKVQAFFDWSTIRPELLISIGQGNHKTTMKSGEIIRTRYGLVGYNLDLKYKRSDMKWSPYLLLEGNKVFGTNKDIKSSRFLVGPGAKFEVSKNFHLALDVVRSETQFYLFVNNQFLEKKDIFYFIRTFGFLHLGSTHDIDFYQIFGLGVSIPDDQQKLDLKLGHSQNIGWQINVPENYSDHDFIFKFMIERQLVRSPQFKETRYFLTLLSGKTF